MAQAAQAALVVKSAVEISDSAESFITGSGGNAVQWFMESAGRSLIKVANATGQRITVHLEKELIFDCKEEHIPPRGIAQWGRKAGTYTIEVMGGSKFTGTITKSGHNCIVYIYNKSIAVRSIQGNASLRDHNGRGPVAPRPASATSTPRPPSAASTPRPPSAASTPRTTSAASTYRRPASAASCAATVTRSDGYAITLRNKATSSKDSSAFVSNGTKVRNGDRVTIVQAYTNGFTKVRAGNGTTGYVKTQYLRR